MPLPTHHLAILNSQFSILNSHVALAGLTLSLVVPSMGQIHKYFGLLGVAVQLAVVPVVLAVGRRIVVPWWLRRVPESWALGLATMTFALLAGLFAVVYPLANSGTIGGGSDRDDALSLAIGALLGGRHPYGVTTYLGNPVSVMPGAIVLAIPFALLGNAAWQNLFWLVVFLSNAKALLGEWRRALLLLWAVLALSPVAIQELLTGGDLLANALYVMACVLWTTDPSRTRRGPWARVPAAILMGVALSSRSHFALLLPLVISAVARGGGWKPAAADAWAVALSFGAVTLPFYLYDPGSFSPLRTIDKLCQFDELLPFASTMIPVGTGLVALGLSLGDNARREVLLRNATIVLALPVAAATILSCIAAAGAQLSMTGYGLSFLFGGGLAYSRGLIPPRAEELGAVRK